jgi:hypothetical protein
MITPAFVSFISLSFTDTLEYGDDTVDLGPVEQLVEVSQVRAIGMAIQDMART